jgi:hypothetical protein
VTKRKAKAKGFKTSPTIHVPKHSVQKMQAAAAAAAAAEVKEKNAIIASLEKAVRGAEWDMAVFMRGLTAAIKLIDLMHQRAGKRPLPLLDPAEIQKLDELRKLSVL